MSKDLEDTTFKICLVQNKNTGCLNVAEAACTRKNIVITLEATMGA